MRGLCFILTLGLTACCPPAPPPPCGEVAAQQTRIVSGQETEPHAFPWQVGVRLYLYIYPPLAGGAEDGLVCAGSSAPPSHVWRLHHLAQACSDCSALR